MSSVTPSEMVGYAIVRAKAAEHFQLRSRFWVHCRRNSNKVEAAWKFLFATFEL